MQRTARTDPPRMVTVGEASQILHVHPNTLRKWSDQGLIPSYRIGQRRDRRFAVEDLVTFLERGGNGIED
ncbi:MAG: helix-turn-helix domain-containing protein [Chloroflexi bacterium]|nr:helix-turn-helix domain-containing protein [Chloroflexota bacterium]